MKQIIGWVCCIFFASCTTRPGSDTSIAPPPSDSSRNTAALLAVLTETVEDYPRAADAWMQRSRLYMEMKDWKAAASDIEQAISLDRNNSTYHYTRALIYDRMGDQTNAWESALQAEKLNNQSPGFFLLMGNLYQSRKEYDKARRYLEKAGEIKPSDGEVYYFKGKVAAATGDTAKALSWYEKALKRRPDYTETYNRMAEIANASGLYTLALEYVRSGLQVDSTNATLYYNQGDAYKGLARIDTAKVLYRKALELQSSLYQANYQLGLLAFYEKNYPAAEQHLEAVKAYEPQYRRLNYLLGMCYLEQGRLEDARAQLKSARQLDSTDKRVLEQYYKVEQIFAAQAARRRQDSLSALLPPVRRVPKSTLKPIEPLVPKGLEMKRDTSR